MLGVIAHSPISRLTVKRLIQAIPVLVGVTLLTFSLMNLLPGGTAQSLAGPGATKVQVQALAVKLHLNTPFFDRYIHWLGGLVSGHFGASLASGQPVQSILGQRLPVTLELVVLAMILSIVIAVPVAILSAYRPGGIVDRFAMLLCMIGVSTPGFVLGLVFILIFGVHLRVLPALGFVPLSQGIGPNLRTMVMPVVTLAIALSSHYVRILRADLADEINGKDYINTARAKGIHPLLVLTRHGLRNSLFSLLTVIGLNWGVLIGGSVLIEQVFSLPGIGQELVQAVQSEDVIVVEAIVVLVSLAVVVSSLLTDIAYSLLDPRVRYGRRA